VPLGFEVGHFFACVVDMSSSKKPTELIDFHASEIWGLPEKTNLLVGWFVFGERES